MPRTLAALAALLALPAALAAQEPVRRDTIRIPAAPGDTLLAPLPPPAPDTVDVFDRAATAALVERVRLAGSTVPPGLEDYLARMRASIHLSVRADTTAAGELPVTVDEFVGDVRWAPGGLLQRITGHRVRQLAPTPYTIGSWLESPWVVPHLYGGTIDVFQLAAQPGRRAAVSSAVHPFSREGLRFYRYAAGDTVRVRTRDGVTTLVPVEVRPRPDAPASPLRQVAGTFFIDVDRAAIARARFGFVERGGGLLVTETGIFFDMDNGLVEGRFWLPVRQRRELQLSSPLLGGAVAVRMVTALSGYRVNTGWRPAEAGARLARESLRGDTVWAGYRDPALDGESGAAIGDFADLREAVRPPRPDAPPTRVALGYERPGHLFRYNRVEGAFVGLGVRVAPREAARRSWDAYGTAGYAFAEGAVRGEGHLRLHPVPARGAPQYTLGAGAYRRLRDTRAFRPAFEWELGYALGAALGGTDQRDYFDAAGAELYGVRRRGAWTARVAGRLERQDSVTRNTGSSLVGGADDFPALAAVEPGSHAALEGELRYVRGAGAFGIVNSTVATLSAEAGVGDFRTQRVIGSLALRRGGRYVSASARVDAGAVAGEAPPQQLFRFGGGEGLRGYAAREFAGSTAALARGRLLLHLPPYGNRPLARFGFFLVPPLRAAVVLSGDAGWSEVSEGSRRSLERLQARTTDGMRYSRGVGLSFFEDAVSVERVWPGEDDREARWYVGFTQWF